MTRPARRVGAAILAAGASRRLGRPKQLLDLGGRPLLQHTLDHVNASRADRVVLVLGANRDQIRPAIDSGRAVIVENADWAAGQSTSMRAGLDALAPEVDAVLFMLGDQPLILTEAIDAVIGAYLGAEARIVLPTYGGQPGQPVLFDRTLFTALREVTGDQGAREVIRSQAASTVRVPITGASRPDDVDDDASYAAVLDAWRLAAR